MKTPLLEIRVNDELVLNAGWWEEGPDYRIVHPPAKTMFEQVVDYLSDKSGPSVPPWPRAGEEGVAATAVCLRWGSYLALLVDRDKPMWSKARSVDISCIYDLEMARINIEVSAALKRWVDLMQHSPEQYRRLVRLAMTHLPMTIRNTKIATDPCHLVTLAQPSIAARLTDAVAPQVLEKARADVRVHPTRALANAMTNFCWRNGPVEEIHAGLISEYPLTQRRVTPREERMLMREVAGRLAQGVIAVSELLSEQSERSWPERVLPFHMVPYWLVTPTGWSLEQQTCDVRLPGREPRRKSAATEETF